MSNDTTQTATMPTKERPYHRLGARLLKARLALKLDTGALASTLECNRALISHVEGGRRLPTQERLIRWAEALQLQADLHLLLLLQQQDASGAVMARVRRRHGVMLSRVQAPRSAS